ncbi:hypothetical protein POM88_011161 [Heracleum sosnowskyi]|uniref:Conserved oligomeric Golgi complex subunit 1 n=2 Tax=Heracleum sosnowskyi TaxID=360622 RepID=A0AAD8IUG4_9APIA|nr:hypothetical protein POM88_011161 [Heracleum sosnowskyi]
MEWIDDIAKDDCPADKACQISLLLHTHFEDVLEDLLIFLESPYASLRQNHLAPCFQSHCYGIMYNIFLELQVEMERLYEETMELVMPRDVAVLRLLSIQRLLFAFQKHSEQITMILGPPKFWVTKAMAHIPSNSSVDSPKSDRAGHVDGSLKEQTSLLDSAGASDSLSSELEVLNRMTKDLLSESRDLWMFWVSEKLSSDLLHNLMEDGNLSATTPLRGWEETVVKQEQSAESTSETKVSLPSMPSKYITFFLNQACVEIRRAGGHVLDKLTLQSFASTLLEKVIGIYGDFISNEEVFHAKVSKEGVLQILLDLGFSVDILSGGDFIGREDVSRQDNSQTEKSISRDSVRTDGLINGLAQRLDPIDWHTYEPYLWENEKQCYLCHAADFEFFAQAGCRRNTAVVQYEDLVSN